MQKQSEMKTHWGKHSPLATPTAMTTAMTRAMHWVTTKQQRTRMQTVMTTLLPTRHPRQATHPNASEIPPKAALIQSVYPGKHSAAMRRPARPPGMHWALPALSLAPALRPHSVKVMRLAMLKRKKWERE